MKVFVASLAVLALAACAEHHPPRHGFGPPGAGPGRWGRGGLFVSPMGEPFRGEGGREALIARWFDGADLNHDGKLTLVEFRADAARFFKTLDLNRDGEIAPDELEHYESDILPETRSGEGMGGGARPGGGSGGMGRGGRHGGMGGGGMGGGGTGGHRGGFSGGSSGGAGQGGGSGLRGAARFDLLGLPEPVASADADMNRGVTAEEFRIAADHRFMLLDTDHDGAIRRDELPSRGPSSRP